MNDLEEPALVWVAVKRLNEGRNALAHGLEGEDIQRKLEAFIKFVQAEQGVPDPEHLDGAIGPFQWAAFQVYSVLAAHVHVDLVLGTLTARQAKGCVG